MKTDVTRANKQKRKSETKQDQHQFLIYDFAMRASLRVCLYFVFAVLLWSQKHRLAINFFSTFFFVQFRFKPLFCFAFLPTHSKVQKILLKNQE